MPASLFRIECDGFEVLVRTSYGDTPHASVIGLPTIYRFEAEICAVCMSGNEGIDYGLDLESTTVPTPAGIAPSISTTIKGVTVYGCVKWGDNIHHHIHNGLTRLDEAPQAGQVKMAYRLVLD